MKKIDRLILRSFVGPLLLTFSLAVLVLLMQFVWKYVDDLVGKGLEFSVIAELLLYASATFVPMALPIAVLFASIMTMGNFGEKYELVAMKAGGISVRRAMMPMALVVLLLTGVAFYFANNVMPTAMLKYRVTLYDITRKKPAINIRPGEYYKELEGYVIRVGEKDKDGHELRDVVIYDHTKGSSQMNVIVAKRGNMQASSDNRFLRFTLYDGYSYSELSDGKNFQRRPFTTVGFREQSINIDIYLIFTFRVRGWLLFVHLFTDVSGVVPLGTISQNGVDGQQMGVEHTLLIVRAMSEDSELHLQRRSIYGITGETLRGTSLAQAACRHIDRGCQS